MIKTLEVQDTYGIGLMTLVLLAEKRPQMFYQYEQEIIKSIDTFRRMSSQSGAVLLHMSKGSKVNMT
jgi:hypothetical protein